MAIKWDDHINLDGIEVICGDCLEELPRLDIPKEKTIIVTSPPYNMNLRVRGKETYASRGFENSSSEEISTKYKNYRDDLPMEVYYNFQKQFLNIALEKANLVFYNIQMITGNKQALFRLMGDFYNKIKEVIIWDKTKAQPAVRDGCLNSRFEFIFILSDISPTRRRFDNACFSRGTLANLWQIKTGQHRGMKAGWPLELVNTILTNFAPEDSIIVDPFMGGGTTGEACVSAPIPYKFIGIERDTETYEMACTRLFTAPLERETK